MSDQNPKNNPVIQMLKDLKASGCSADAVNCLLDELGNLKKLTDATELWRRHAYPEKTIEWVKLSNQIRLSRTLSPPQLAVLLVFIQNAGQSNLVQIGSRTLSEASGLNDRTVRTALAELQERGFLAVKVPAAGRNPAIYMLNPEVSTAGKSRARIQEFWKLTGSEYDKDGKIKTESPAHRKWTFVFGSSVETVAAVSADKKLRYNIVRPIERVAPPAGTGETT